MKPLPEPWNRRYYKSVSEWFYFGVNFKVLLAEAKRETWWGYHYDEENGEWKWMIR